MHTARLKAKTAAEIQYARLRIPWDTSKTGMHLLVNHLGEQSFHERPLDTSVNWKLMQDLLGGL